jgi:hypothetical protein
MKGCWMNRPKCNLKWELKSTKKNRKELEINLAPTKVDICWIKTILFPNRNLVGKKFFSTFGQPTFGRHDVLPKSSKRYVVQSSQMPFGPMAFDLEMLNVKK